MTTSTSSSFDSDSSSKSSSIKMHAEPTDALSSCSVAASTTIDVAATEALKNDDAATAAPRGEVAVVVV